MELTQTPIYKGGELVGYGYSANVSDFMEMKTLLESISLDFNFNKVEVESTNEKENKFIPIAVYCNTEKKTTVVKWADGTETKVTCDDQDTFSPDAGYSECLKIKLFGNNKAKFKDFWSAVISRRVFVDGVKVKPEAYGRWEKERKAESKARKAKKPKAKK